MNNCIDIKQLQKQTGNGQWVILLVSEYVINESEDRQNMEIADILVKKNDMGFGNKHREIKVQSKVKLKYC